MSLKPILTTSLSQRLVLTPQMRQRIELLTMTKLELNDLIAAELAANPILEELAADETPESTSDSEERPAAEPAPEAPATDGKIADGAAAEAAGANASVEGAVSAETSPVDAASEIEGEPETSTDSFEEVDFGTTFEEYLDPGYKTQEPEVKDDAPSFENFLTRPLSLAEHLNFQIRLAQADDVVQEIGEAIVGNLDGDGFLVATPEEIAVMGGWSIEQVTETIHLVQRLDPAGVAATGPRESLLVQLEVLGYSDRFAYRLVNEFFDKLQQHRIPELSKTLGVSMEEIRSELDLIRTLDPHPGRKHSGEQAQYIEPEVYIEKLDDDYVIYFNDDGLPQLRINPTYRRMMNSTEATKEIRDYIKEHYRSAVDLLKNIEHRKQTIYRVCKSIVDRQRGFLDHGIEHLHPMMLKDIAEDIGMHLSTVSRVVNRKYVHTPQGVIELRRFFTEGMTNDDGEEISTRVLKLQIKKMIEAEDPHNPITDDQVAKILAKEGMKLSRRTVAKYRDQLKIPGSRERRVVV